MDAPYSSMPNAFRRDLRAGKSLIGCWASLGSNITTEVLGYAGFDWLLIDGEHAPNDYQSFIAQLQALKDSPSAPFVRPQWQDPVVIKRLLDIGFYNFLIPVFGSIVIPGGGGATYPANTPPNTQAQSQAALRTVFAALQSYGYTSFENFNFGGFFGYTAQQYRAIFESYGLHAVSDHSTLNTATIDARLDEAQALGVKYVGSGGWPVGTDMNTLAGALNMASVLNQLGQKAAGLASANWLT